MVAIQSPSIRREAAAAEDSISWQHTTFPDTLSDQIRKMVVFQPWLWHQHQFSPSSQGTSINDVESFHDFPCFKSK